eukprot:Nitzschia sp. Nitz4//scaffold149_size55946//32377//33174//NITZ4_006597-RA/size55946-processed-gene-0.30-mRNA-1//-1//CDS//3329536818//678//frame0
MDDHQHLDDAGNLQFPWKLHVLLDEAEQEKFQDIVSWLPSGDAFKVHDKERFSDEVLSKYFTSSKFKSFQRNLNLWGFRTQTKEPAKGVIYHPFFRRGQANRCHLMKRIRVKKRSQVTHGDASSTFSSPEGTPVRSQRNTFSMPSMISKAQLPVLPPFKTSSTSPHSMLHHSSASPSTLGLPPTHGVGKSSAEVLAADALVSTILESRRRQTTMALETLRQQNELHHHILQASAQIKMEQERLKMKLIHDSVLLAALGPGGAPAW